MIIAVTGPKGRLGTELVKNHNCVPLDCDISDQESIRDALDTVKPDIIINCASKTNVDLCETEIIKAYAVNSIGPLNLTCLFTGTIVHISTDFIFNGEAGPYDEYAIPDPKNKYGLSKLFGETSIKRRPNNLVVRTTILYDATGLNFATSVINTLKATGFVKAPKELSGTPTYIPHLAFGIMNAIEKNIRGVINIVGSDTVTRYEFAQLLAEKFGYNTQNILDVLPFGDAHRPKYAGLKVEKARQLNVPIFSLEQGIDAFYESFTRNNS